MGDVKGKRLTIYLQPEVWKKTQQVATYYHLNFSQMISTLLWREYQKQYKNIEILERIFPTKDFSDKGEKSADVQPSSNEEG